LIKVLKMATSPRSPKTPGKFSYDKEDSSFWEKLGTLGRKKKIKEGKLVSFKKIFHRWGNFLFYF
jgi:hypothetical protein